MSHWYNSNGELFESVPNKSRPGEYRDMTLADVRKWPEPLFCSVTTVLNDTVPKPGLVRWQVEQGIKAVIANPMTGDESFDHYVARMVKASEEYRDYAAKTGIEIHKVVSDTLKGKVVTPASHGLSAYSVGRNIVLYLEASGYRCETPERTFCAAHLGFAGTADWQGWGPTGKRTILDIKTQEWDEGKTENYYDEHPLQLAGYAAGLNEYESDRVSLIAHRVTGEIKTRNWSKPTERDRDPNATWMRRWEKLLDYWFESRSYWPHQKGLHTV